MKTKNPKLRWYKSKGGLGWYLEVGVLESVELFTERGAKLLAGRRIPPLPKRRK